MTDGWRTALAQHIATNPGGSEVMGDLFDALAADMPLYSATRMWKSSRPHHEISHEQLRWSAFLHQTGLYHHRLDPPRCHGSTVPRSAVITFLVRPCVICGTSYAGTKRCRTCSLPCRTLLVAVTKQNLRKAA
jgi:hypothetical protein